MKIFVRKCWTWTWRRRGTWSSSSCLCPCRTSFDTESPLGAPTSSSACATTRKRTLLLRRRSSCCSIRKHRREILAKVESFQEAPTMSDSDRFRNLERKVPAFSFSFGRLRLVHTCIICCVNAVESPFLHTQKTQRVRKLSISLHWTRLNLSEHFETDGIRTHTSFSCQRELLRTSDHSPYWTSNFYNCAIPALFLSSTSLVGFALE